MKTKQQCLTKGNICNNQDIKNFSIKSNLPKRKKYSIHRSLHDFLSDYQIGTMNEYGKLMLSGVRIC